MRSKYGNVKTHGFDSKSEYARWLELQLLEKAGKIRDLKRQVKIPIKVNGCLVCTYVADFTYDVKNHDLWTPVLEDVKGVRTAIFRLKKKLLWAAHGLFISEVNAKDLRIRRAK
jgi:hypothetical protein